MIKKKIVMYLRKSRTDSQSESVAEVLARHEQMLQDYCMRTFGEPIPEENIMREVVSGETIDDRPVMIELLQEIEEGEIDSVIVIEPQRLSRGSFGDIDRIVNTFRYTDTKVITLTKTYNLNDKFDRKYFEQELLRGNDYLEYIKEILFRGRKRSVEEGLYIGSVPVFGYDKVKLPKKGYTLIPNDDAEIVKYIFDKFNGGLGSFKLAAHLNEIGLKSRSGSPWSASMVKHILRNRIYIGYLSFGKRKRVKQMKDGELINARITQDEYTEIKGVHTPIITDEVFNKTQKILKLGAKPVRVDRGLKNPLAGLIKCKYCGRTLCRRVIHNKTVLYCPTLGCKNVSSSLELIEDRLISLLSKELSECKVYIDNYEEEIEKTAFSTVKQIQKIDKELITLKTDLQNALIKYNRGKITEDEYSFLRNFTTDEEKRLKEMRSTLENLVATDELDKKRKAIPVLENCVTKYSTLNVEEKHSMLETIIEKIIYEKKEGGRWNKEAQNAFVLDIFLRI